MFISGFWVLIALATALQDWLTLRADLGSAVRFAASLWLPWALLTPAVAWLSTTFSLERKGWRRALAAHLAGCACTGALLLASALLLRLVAGRGSCRALAGFASAFCFAFTVGFGFAVSVVLRRTFAAC